MSEPAKLEESIRHYLTPLLREDEFIGSGRTFRRVTGEFIQVVNIQGSRRGGKFAINLGLQPLALPDVLGGLPNVRTITESLCEFRRRLSESGGDQWWDHDASQLSMNAACGAAARVYVVVGRRILSQVAAPDSPFLTTTPDQFRSNRDRFLGFSATLPRMALALARMRLAKGKVAEARAFAEVGLSAVGSAVFLRSELQDIQRVG